VVTGEVEQMFHVKHRYCGDILAEEESAGAEIDAVYREEISPGQTNVEALKCPWCDESRGGIPLGYPDVFLSSQGMLRRFGLLKTYLRRIRVWCTEISVAHARRGAPDGNLRTVSDIRLAAPPYA